MDIPKFYTELIPACDMSSVVHTVSTKPSLICSNVINNIIKHYFCVYLNRNNQHQLCTILHIYCKSTNPLLLRFEYIHRNIFCVIFHKAYIETAISLSSSFISITNQLMKNWWVVFTCAWIGRIWTASLQASTPFCQFLSF